MCPGRAKNGVWNEDCMHFTTLDSYQVHCIAFFVLTWIIKWSWLTRLFSSSWELGLSIQTNQAIQLASKGIEMIIEHSSSKFSNGYGFWSSDFKMVSRNPTGSKALWLPGRLQPLLGCEPLSQGELRALLDHVVGWANLALQSLRVVSTLETKYCWIIFDSISS